MQLFKKGFVCFCASINHGMKNLISVGGNTGDIPPFFRNLIYLKKIGNDYLFPSFFSQSERKLKKNSNLVFKTSVF